jgi:hypothetical protein
MRKPTMPKQCVTVKITNKKIPKDKRKIMEEILEREINKKAKELIYNFSLPLECVI